MKLAPLAAALLIVAPAVPALAGDQAEKVEPAALSSHSPIETLMADEGAKAIVLKHLPGLDQHPSYEQFKTMSLVALQPWSQGQITDEILAAISAELAAMGEVAA